MRTLRLSLGFALSCLASLGCQDDGSLAEFHVSVAPVPLEGSLLYAHRVDGAGDALIVDVSGAKPRIASHRLPAGDLKSYPRPGSAGHEVVVLTGGLASDPAAGQRESIGSAVLVFDRHGERFRKTLDGRFSDLTLSPDGRVALAHGHGAGAGVDVGNTVAIVDLSDPSLDVRTVALSDSTGRPAQSFAFPDPADGSRRLLVARGVDNLTILELDYLDRKPKEVPLKLPSDGRALQAGKLIFRADEIFVQIEGSSDVLLLQLVPLDAAGPEAFKLVPLYLATSANVQDIELVREGGPDRRLVALGQGKVSVVDPVTGDATTSNTDASYDDLIRFVGRSPVDDELRERGLLVPHQGSRIAFVDFANGTAWSDEQVETLDLPDQLQSVIPLNDHRLVVLLYSSGGLGLVDLDARKVTPISTGSTVQSMLIDESPQEANLWLSLTNEHVARVNLLGLDAREIALAAQADQLLLIEGSPRKIAAVHDSDAGFVTLLDPAEPSRATARELVSFFYTDILD
ncbi:MAG: hypothetical protein QM778_04010 [Myxococcales bacterium]